MQCSRLLYPFAWLPRRAKHHGQKVTRLSDFENANSVCGGLWWFACIVSGFTALSHILVVVCGDVWWFWFFSGGLWWFAVVCGDLR